jgi:hypothetical protein
MHGVIADADGDIAALVYTAGDRPDLVLCAFAEHLAASGKRLCGLVQFRDGRRDGSPGRVMVLDRWRIVEVGGRRDAPADSSCRLDAGWLDRMGTRARVSIEQGVDTVIVNRFGPLEAAGRGFRDAILAASETQTPLIIAVPEFEFERWTRFSRVWLHAGVCCYTDQPITVTVRGDGFATTGEGIWRDDEHGYTLLGPRRWTPSPWRATPAELEDTGEGLRAYGEDCSAALAPSGKIVVSGARSWTFSVSGDIWRIRGGETAWFYAAASHDCSAIVAATERRLIWVKSR